MDSGPDELLGRALAEIADKSAQLRTARAELARTQRRGVTSTAKQTALNERVRALEVQLETLQKDVEELRDEQRARPGIDSVYRKRLESLVDCEDEEAAARAKAAAEAEKQAAEIRAENLRRAAERRARIWDFVKLLVAAAVGFVGSKLGSC